MTAGATLMPDLPRGHRAERWLRIVVVAVGATAVVRLVRAADLGEVTRLIERSGWPLALVLLPTAVAMGVDAEGWRLVLRALGSDVRWSALVRARLAVESIVLSAPGGPVAGEAIKVGLLSWRAGVPVPTGAASLALTKACLWGGEAIYLLAASAALAAGAAAATHGLLSLTLGGAAAVATLSALAFAVLRGGEAAARGGAWLARVPIERFRRWIEARREALATLDQSTRSFFAAPPSLRARCLAMFTLEWFVEGAETLLILRCIGVDISVGQALALDGVTSLLRAAAFFVPAGIGVQDVTQLLLLRRLGVSDASAAAAALIFIKRTKEVFWVFTGSLFLAGTKRA
jgi:uncharacterized membrane protein YbhN (UPF0104 family)